MWNSQANNLSSPPAFMKYLNIRLHAQKNTQRQDHTPNKLTLNSAECWTILVNVSKTHKKNPNRNSNKCQSYSDIFKDIMLQDKMEINK